MLRIARVDDRTRAGYGGIEAVGRADEDASGTAHIGPHLIRGQRCELHGSGAADRDIEPLRGSAAGERAAPWQGHREAVGVDAGDDDVAAASERQPGERRDDDLDAHRALRRQVAGSVRDHEHARLHVGCDAAEEVLIGLHDDGLLVADANHHVVAACEFDMVERGHLTGLRRRNAGAFGGRGRRVTGPPEWYSRAAARPPRSRATIATSTHAERCRSRSEWTDVGAVAMGPSLLGSAEAAASGSPEGRCRVGAHA